MQDVIMVCNECLRKDGSTLNFLVQDDNDSVMICPVCGNRQVKNDTDNQYVVLEKG